VISDRCTAFLLDRGSPSRRRIRALRPRAGFSHDVFRDHPRRFRHPARGVVPSRICSRPQPKLMPSQPPSPWTGEDRRGPLLLCEVALAALRSGVWLRSTSRCGIRPPLWLEDSPEYRGYPSISPSRRKRGPSPSVRCGHDVSGPIHLPRQTKPEAPGRCCRRSNRSHEALDTAGIGSIMRIPSSETVGEMPSWPRPRAGRASETR